MIESAQPLDVLIGTCQSLSQETVLERLLEQLAAAVVKHAGAVRGVVLLAQAGELRIMAESRTRDDVVQMVTKGAETIGNSLPTSVLDQMVRTQQVVVVGDQNDPQADGSDPYFASAGVRSALCLPLVSMQRLVGAIYLEDDRAAGTFDQKQRLSVLQLLASQAAVSIDNAVLVHNVQRAEQDARQARDEWRQEIDRIPVQIWRTDAKGVLEAANKHWHDFTGMTHEYASGEAQKYRNTCHPDDSEKVFGLMSRLHETGVSGEIECRMLRFDGVYRRVLARAAPLLDETGAVIRWHGTTIDIEELKRAEEAQEALARISRVTALGELAVSIAHEINQPLMSIVTNAATCLRWLASESPNLPEARLAAERIVRDGHRAGDVIASIRELARKAPPKIVKLDVNRVIDEVLAFARNELERHGISVATRLAAGNCVTLADRVQIQQVVLNLIMNGIEAMDGQDAGSRVLIIGTEEIDRRFVEVAVSDTGRGLDVDDAERVFDAFFTSKVGGIGMGLSICRSIVENHGGRMAVSPNRPQGCTFSFQLPAYAQEQPHAP